MRYSIFKVTQMGSMTLKEIKIKSALWWSSAIRFREKVVLKEIQKLRADADFKLGKVDKKQKKKKKKKKNSP